MSVIGVKNGKYLLVPSISQFDPDVWSGRALQVDFAELAVSGLASMYPAFDWSVWCSGPSRIYVTMVVRKAHVD
jgi:hypothetical protein